MSDRRVNQHVSVIVVVASSTTWLHLRRQWNVVGHVKKSISGQKSRPRVGKAISIILPDLDDNIVSEWFA